MEKALGKYSPIFPKQIHSQVHRLTCVPVHIRLHRGVSLCQSSQRCRSVHESIALPAHTWIHWGVGLHTNPRRCQSAHESTDVPNRTRIHRRAGPHTNPQTCRSTHESKKVQVHTQIYRGANPHQCPYVNTRSSSNLNLHCDPLLGCSLTPPQWIQMVHSQPHQQGRIKVGEVEKI